MTRGRLYVGTSGFSYREWQPDFYPADLKPREFLPYFAERLPSVEINSTFYRLPRADTLRGWAEQTPEGFAFSLKAPRRITHDARLAGTEEIVGVFLEAARALGDRLGVILFQCPPSLRCDAALLETFLARLPGGGMRFAFEFRHASWDSEDVRSMLATHGAAWCVADTEKDAAGGEAPLGRTAPDFVFLRLRRDTYDGEALRLWAARATETLESGCDVYCYFKHEDDPSAVSYALGLRDLVTPNPETQH